MTTTTKKVFCLKDEFLFNTLLKIRFGMYDLKDIHLMQDEDIDAFEEVMLSRAGIDYEKYADWKNC